MMTTKHTIPAGRDVVVNPSKGESVRFQDASAVIEDDEGGTFLTVKDSSGNTMGKFRQIDVMGWYTVSTITP